MLTAQEKHNVIRLLGWPGRTIDNTSTAYNSVITDRATYMTPEMEAEVRGLLDRIVALDLKLEKALCRASTKEVDGIVLNSEFEIEILRKERKRLIRELSDLTEIPYVASGGAVGNVMI